MARRRGGFDGLGDCARGIGTVRITLLDRTNHHLFQPLLYQVATAGLSAPDIAAPLRHILRAQRNVEVQLGEVVAIDVPAKRVALADGGALAYDTLVLATGATHAYFGHDEWAPHAPGLKTLADGFAIRAKTIGAFERAERALDDADRDAWLSFVVIGAGPTGVEMAGTLSEIARHTLHDEFATRAAARAWHLVEPRARVECDAARALGERTPELRASRDVRTGAPHRIDGKRALTTRCRRRTAAGAPRAVVRGVAPRRWRRSWASRGSRRPRAVGAQPFGPGQARSSSPSTSRR